MEDKIPQQDDVERLARDYRDYFERNLSETHNPAFTAFIAGYKAAKSSQQQTINEDKINMAILLLMGYRDDFKESQIGYEETSTAIEYLKSLVKS